MITVAADTCQRQIAAIFLAWGYRPDHVPTIVELMVESDLRGIDSHGIGKLTLYDMHRRQGKLNMRPEPRVVRDLPAVALVDGDDGMGHWNGKLAMDLAIAKAREAGVGLVAVTRSYHFGAAGVYSSLAAEAGFIGLASTGTTQLSVVPTFGRTALFGTNPIAFAAPGEAEPPFELDMATSTVAVGKVDIARRAGKRMPEGWAMDAEGRPETDPSAALAVEPKRLTPLGGTRTLGSHKGYGLAMMMEILATLLPGANVASRDPRSWTVRDKVGNGHVFLALDPAFFRGDAATFRREMDGFVRFLRATEPADAAEPVLVPGDPEHAARAERIAGGIPMTDTLAREVREIAAAAGAPYLLDDREAA